MERIPRSSFSKVAEHDNDKTEEAEKLESLASTITTIRVEDNPPLIEKDDGSFMIFGHWIKLEKECMNPDDGVSSVKARPFFFEPIKIDKQEKCDKRLLFRSDFGRKMNDFNGLLSSSSEERKENNVNALSLKAVQESPVDDDENSIDLTLRLGPPVNKKRSLSSTSDDQILSPSMNKKQKTVAGGPSSSTSGDLKLKIGLPVNAQENVVNVTPPNPRELVFFGQQIVVHDQDPWKIKKDLKKSDVNGSSRLLIGIDMVTNHILPYVRHNNPNFHETQGVEVDVWDVDTRSSHRLKFKRWKSNSFVFVGGWTADFVKRRNLKENDTIGLTWDHANSRLEFTLLHRHH